MSDPMTRRSFSVLSAAFVLGPASDAATDDKPKAEPAKMSSAPIEAPFERDYAPPGFKPSWKKRN